jgi:hypothetical protein
VLEFLPEIHVERNEATEAYNFACQRVMEFVYLKKAVAELETLRDVCNRNVDDHNGLEISLYMEQLAHVIEDFPPEVHDKVVSYYQTKLEDKNGSADPEEIELVQDEVAVRQQLAKAAKLWSVLEKSPNKVSVEALKARYGSSAVETVSILQAWEENR